MEGFYFTDSDGQKITDFEKYFAENPEALVKQKDLLTQRMSLGLNEYPFADVLEEHRYGSANKFINDIYRFFLNEIHSKRTDADYLEYLTEQKEKFRGLVCELNTMKTGLLEPPPNIEHFISTFERITNTIEREISLLEREKTKKHNTPSPKNKGADTRILAYDNDVLSALEHIETILDKINLLLFENSTIEQWEQLLNGDYLTTPIVIKKGVIHRDIKYFLDELERKGILMAKYTVLESINAFHYRGKHLTQTQISKAYKNNFHRKKEQIDDIISLLE